MDIVFTFDVDSIGQNSIHYNNKPNFDLEKEIFGLFDFIISSGIKKFTAFPRIDLQIEKTFNDFHHVEKMIPSIDGIEIGWHCHFINEKNNDIHEENEVIDQMRLIYHNSDIRKCASVRVGGCFMTNRIIEFLDHCKFICDSTALPGRMEDSKRKYDWSRCGNTCYKPSRIDYQTNGSNCFNITEVPMTTVIGAGKRRYLNPCLKPEIFRQMIDFSLNYLNCLVIVFHADQLKNGYEDDFYKYGFDNFHNNMIYLLSQRSFNFKNVKDLAL